MRVARLGLVSLGLAVLALGTSAHLGSPDTWFEGQAGPYPVQVVIRLPGVIPGLGQIDVTVVGGNAERVTAQPIRFDTGRDGAPPPDVATPVPGRPDTYHAALWFMRQGSYSVAIEVSGARGSGSVLVPVTAVAERQLALSPWLGGLLGLLGVLLFAGALSVFWAAATDGVTPPGEDALPFRRRAGVVSTGFGAALLGLALFGANRWWDAVENRYRAGLYRPFRAAAAVDTVGVGRTLLFTIADSVWVNSRGFRNPLLPDHGKLMHLFMIERGDSGAPGTGFAHLHPASIDSLQFVAALAGLRGGRYDVYADVVHENGFPQTLVAGVDVPPPMAGDLDRYTDIDDVVAAVEPAETAFTLPDGAVVTWEGRPESPRAGEPARLDFSVHEPGGELAHLEPYLGMAGHAVVQRDDGQVYIHLHPNGTISTVAQAALGARLRTDTLPGMVAKRLADSAGAAHVMHPSFEGRLSFPYAFPEPGAYRIWIQFKRGSQIFTAAFRTAVR
ncbi:MAG: hypothetical protein AB7L66_00440 [Gemmatimonadales bacterium]